MAHVETFQSLYMKTEVHPRTRGDFDVELGPDLNETECQEIERRVRGILEEAPSDAHAEFIVRKSPRGYKGLLKISSRQQKFVGGSIGSKVRDVVNSAFDEVRDQIRQWKRNRSISAP